MILACGTCLSGMRILHFFAFSVIPCDAGNGNIQNRLGRSLYLRVLQPENHSDRDLSQPIVRFGHQTVSAQVGKR